MALNKKNRLKKKCDFDEVFKNGRVVKGNFLFIKYIKNKLGAPRFGFVISTKVVRSAVERNKTRRILSEAVRGMSEDLGGYDVIVLTTKKITVMSRKDIVEDFLDVLRKIQ